METEQLSQRAAHAVCVGEPHFCRSSGFIHSPGCYRRHSVPETTVSEQRFNGKYELREHDVLIIGAGGAGLRAAIEALAQGAIVAVICKSLLGQSHTVMAEGGIAAAMANLDRSGDWRTHFRETMSGGKFLHNLRLAHLP